MNVLIIGTGGFGKHYAQILSQLESSGIDKVIITRTSVDSAVEQAVTLQKETKTDVIGVKVSNLYQLVTVLNEYRPGFTAVTTREDTHLQYTAAAIRYGIVLCEKPFANAKGDRKSLEHFDFNHHERFGLELPFAVVYNEIQKNPELYKQLLNARKIRFAWITKGKGNKIIDDLALHPWSLIPEEFKLEKVVDVDGNEQGTEAKAFLDYSYDSHPVRIEIHLAYGGNFTGLEIDGTTLGIKRQGVNNTLVDMGTQLPLDDVISGGNEGIEGRELLVVVNPLEQHIIAALKGTPIVGWERAYASQEFLEKLHEYEVKP